MAGDGSTCLLCGAGFSWALGKTPGAHVHLQSKTPGRAGAWHARLLVAQCTTDVPRRPGEAPYVLPPPLPPLEARGHVKVDMDYGEYPFLPWGGISQVPPIFVSAFRTLQEMEVLEGSGSEVSGGPRKLIAERAWLRSQKDLGSNCFPF